MKNPQLQRTSNISHEDGGICWVMHQYLCILFFSYVSEWKDVEKYPGFEITGVIRRGLHCLSFYESQATAWIEIVKFSSKFWIKGDLGM